jgi:DNA replication and repair protein RecF
VRVDRLETVNFRNLEQTELELAPGVNLFVGENGQGKTNLLEAVYLFKFGRSFRTHRETELIGFDKSYFRIGSTCSYDDGYTEEFSISVERNGRKRITVSGGDVPRLSELIGRYPVVLFGPHDLRIVSGSPGERRRFVDIVGSMTSPVYFSLLKDYRRILNQRNAALKARASADERDAWNSELVEKGIDLIVCRQELTTKLEEHLLSHVSDLDVPFRFSLEYNSAIARESAALADNGQVAGPEELKSVFEARLVSLEHEELRRGTTLAGPHRDDVTIGLSGKEVRKYGSQGQRRLLVVLLKLSEMTFLEAENREPCVLLLDDVFSEFDDPITRKLQVVLESGRQVLVTSPVSLDWAASRDVRQFTVENGSIIF